MEGRLGEEYATLGTKETQENSEHALLKFLSEQGLPVVVVVHVIINVPDSITPISSVSKKGAGGEEGGRDKSSSLSTRDGPGGEDPGRGVTKQQRFAPRGV